MLEKQNTIGTVFVISAGFFWGIMSIFIRFMSSYGFSPMQIVCGRLTVAFIFFAIMIAIKEPENIKRGFKGLPLFLLIGIFNILMFTWCYFTAVSMMDVSVAVILLYTSPLWVMIASVIFFKEKITKRKILSMSMAIAGCIFISGFAADSLTPLGIIVGLGAGIGYGMYSIFGTIALKQYSTFTITTFSFAIAAIGSWILSDTSEMLDLYVTGGLHILVPFTILMGIFTAFIPFLLYTYGLERIPPSKAIVLVTVEPIVATITGVVVFNEAFGLASLLGFTLVIGAILLLSKKE